MHLRGRRCTRAKTATTSLEFIFATRVSDEWCFTLTIRTDTQDRSRRSCFQSRCSSRESDAGVAVRRQSRHKGKRIDDALLLQQKQQSQQQVYQGMVR